MRVIGPKKPGDPNVGCTCAICESPIAVGDLTTILSLPTTEEEASRAERGLPYARAPKEVHLDCAVSPAEEPEGP